MKVIEQIDAETAQKLGLNSKRRQAKGRQPGLKDTARMRLEGQDTLLRAERARELTGLADDKLVTEMDAVEIADRDRAAARASRKPAVMAIDIHRLLDYRPPLRTSEENMLATRRPVPAVRPCRASEAIDY